MENSKKLIGKYIIVKDLHFSDFMKKENGEIILFDTYIDAIDTCGMYEFPNVLILQIVNNYIEPQE